MAVIDQYLQKILEATYGEEVRDSIHDAIKQNYLDITESVNRANAAAAAANQAAQNVNAVVDTANRAASTANSASQRATEAATLVEEIEQDYENATAEATAVQPGGTPTATLTDGPNGKKFVFGLPSGATPQIGIGTVTTGAAGSNAEVTISGSADAPQLNFKIPRGDTGATPTVYGNTVPMSASDSTTVAQAIANATDADAIHSINGKTATNHAVTVNADDIKMSASDTTNISDKLKEYVKTVNGTAPDPITGNVNVATGGGDSTVGLIRRVIGIAVSDWAGSGPYTYTYQDADIKVGMVVLEDTLSDEYAQLGINTYTVQNGSLTIATTVKPTADWSLDIALGMDGSSILDDVGDLQTKVGTSTLTTTAQNLSDAVNELDDDLSQQSQQIVNLGNAIAYVENGDDATRTYTAGTFILWKGTLYTVNNEGIAAEKAIAGHVAKVTDGGGLNDLNNEIITLNNYVLPYIIASESELIALSNQMQTGTIRFIIINANAITGMTGTSFGIVCKLPDTALACLLRMGMEVIEILFNNQQIARKSKVNLQTF